MLFCARLCTTRSRQALFVDCALIKASISAMIDIIVRQLQLKIILLEMISSTAKDLLRTLKQVFPVLKPKGLKGENGRIAVIGGSFQFTGAPFYSAISSLKVGGDLAHIFCSKSSSPSIKSYSPQIIVHPVFVSEEEFKYSQTQVKSMHQEWIHKIKTWQKAITSWIIGPGLGRDRYMNEFFPILVRGLPEGSLVIFDADGIYYLSQHPQLLNELKRFKAILTPNLREVGFLSKHIKIDIEEILKQRNSQEIQMIENKETNANFTLLIKGQSDVILGPKSYIVNTEGGLKRCGGMGDILAGATAVCSLWDFQNGPALASLIVRLATRAAFEKQGRGLTAPCVIREISQVVSRIQSQKFDL